MPSPLPYSGPRDAILAGIVELLGDLFDNSVEKFAVSRRAGDQLRGSRATIVKQFAEKTASTNRN
jgi:hypothetical protein